MTEWWAFKPVTTAFEKTKKLLLSPFNAWTWIKLIVIVFFVGGASKVGSNFSNFYNYGGNPASGIHSWDIANFLTNRSLIMLILFIILLVLVIMLILAYLRNVFSFALIKSVTTGDVHVIKPALENLGRGLRLFVFTLLVGLFTLLVAVVLVVAMIACILIAIKVGVASAGAVLLVLLLALIIVLLLLLLIAFCIAMGVFMGFTYDFVAPMMYFKGKGVIASWKELYALVKKEWQQFGIYIITRWALEFALGIIMAIITVPILLVYIALLIIGLIAALALMKTSILLAVIIGICILIGTILFLALVLIIEMPVGVYLRYFSLDVLKIADPAAVAYTGKMGT